MRGRVCAGIYFRDNEQYGKAYEALKRKLPKAEFSEKSQINPTVCIYRNSEALANNRADSVEDFAWICDTLLKLAPIAKSAVRGN
jgi:hypothetical protein